MRFWALALTVLVSLNAGAQEAEHDEIYLKTFARCSKTLNASGTVNVAQMIWRMFQFQTVREGFGQSFQVLSGDPVAIATAIETRGLTPRVSVFLNSPSFYKALDDCYGDNFYLKKTYTTGLILSDSTGQATGAAVSVASLFLVGRILKPVFKLYPRAAFLITSSLSAYVASAAVRDLYNFYYREPTPEEKAEAEKLISGLKTETDRYVSEVARQVEERLLFLNEKLKTAPESERPLIEEKIAIFKQYLKNMQAPEPSAPSEVKP